MDDKELKGVPTQDESIKLANEANDREAPPPPPNPQST